MTEPKDAPSDPFGAFVVVTRMKPDGRLIHYYEWPKGPPEPGPVDEQEPGIRDTGERRHV